MTVSILVGDALEQLRTLPGESVHCCVTSPPYWGLRDYGIVGQIGLEPTLSEYLITMDRVFAEVRRVLRDDGVLWLNLGDAYNAYNGGAGPGSKLSATQTEQRPQLPSGYGLRTKALKPKDRMMIPARVAIALQESGWWLRDEIVWHKPNPMPSSVADRTTPAHEMLYLLSKSARYYYDGDAIREPFADSSIQRLSQPSIDQQTGGDKSDQYEDSGLNARSGSRRPNEIVAGLAQKITRKPAGWDTADGSHSTLRHTSGRSGNKERKLGIDRGRPDSHIGGSVPWEGTTRNKRSVWTIATEAFPDAHFATFPTALIEPCILAGCPEGGTVLDPFGGAGTTGLVADRLKRNAILIELNPIYAAMARQRIKDDAGLFASIAEPLSSPPDSHLDPKPPSLPL